ncbi:SRPBCC family protein [uncultured Cellulomonas sp.]|uniref:SRPBCC family protein n=1 Tax=uncultured Cellulomonas sp. TaxID=189682 RepID=UPI00261F67F9|nr:SRPBCC family protein [uncultured Cellulomonas sp.]
MTSTVAVTRVIPLPLTQAWELVVDPRHHARWIPLTRITVEGLPIGVGTQVRAVSGPFTDRGVPGLLDTMRVDVFDPPGPGHPGEAQFTKLGPVLLGSAGIFAAGVDDGRTAVTWTETVHLAGPVPRALTAALLAPVMHLMLRFALYRVGRDAARGRV